MRDIGLKEMKLELQCKIGKDCGIMTVFQLRIPHSYCGEVVCGICIETSKTWVVLQFYCTYLLGRSGLTVDAYQVFS